MTKHAFGKRGGVHAAAVVVLLAALGALAGPIGAPAARAATAFKVLQVNLCNSGHAGCYEGGAVPEAQSLIGRVKPDVLTANEICESDVGPLRSAMGNGDYEFRPVEDERTAAAIQCTGGRGAYGVAVLAVPRYGKTASGGGWYSYQDAGSERRAWGCGRFGGFWACTTHLSSSDEPVALQQCRQLMNEYIPQLHAQYGGLPTVVGADLNLEYDRSDPENAQNCVPGGYFRKGDGDVQHVIASSAFAFVRTDKYGMSRTDHDAFMVTLTAPW
ncbi:endonuclease/exonuclease/phosphatase family protein [Sphaerisporangium dianthi]|uniref:Endonuclease/exonuclease/phosphatase family protein n=1 Tax=Sphaerisporangium dianthi TaxID=1436120 RepID=A0ABV9CDC5_9ACTN